MLRSAILIIAVLSSLVGLVTTPFMAIATGTYLLLITGLYFKNQKKLHARIMSIAIIIDVALVLILAIKRNAIGTALGLELGFLQQSHVYTSTLATILYIPTMFFGIRLVRALPNNSRSLILWHKLFAISAFIFRTLGFILMFSLLDIQTA